MTSETIVTHNCCELIYKDYVQYLIGWVYLNSLGFDSNMWEIFMQNASIMTTSFRIHGPFM